MRKLGSTDKNRGFTLIEIAIGLIVIGLLTLPLIELYRINIKRAKLGFNAAHFNQITENLNQYVIDNGTYPAPASLLASPATPDEFGEMVSGPFNPCPSWPTPNGVCRTTGPNPVLIGAVPFEELGLNPDFALDYWGNKITYVVTESQTVAYTRDCGGININGYGVSPGAGLPSPYEPLYDSTAPVCDDDNTRPDVFLISHGENGFGGYTEAGNLIGACPAAAQGLEYENCNFDNQFVLRENPNVVPDSGDGIATSSVAGSTFFDDDTEMMKDISLGNWFDHQSGIPASANYAVTLASRIGIGTEDPQARVHVAGDMYADGLLSDEICADGETDCFNPEFIAGDHPDWDCTENTIPGSEPILKVGERRVFCASPVDTASPGNVLDGEAFVFPNANFSWINCADSGQLMVGIDSSGAPICQTP